MIVAPGKVLYWLEIASVYCLLPWITVLQGGDVPCASGPSDAVGKTQAPIP